ncbi:winged helix-turn-helix domain-containing protein [Paraburkholderia sp. A1RI-2L]|uniref:winged helix-turn-helix domain-containing protein n=1 Tax=Paraburkholderia sp. A1RI-2L TaxID=3028367 RepID=UPI003BA00203
MVRRTGNGFLPAAEAVLKRAGKPLSCREIIERAIAAGLLESSGKTPTKTLYALFERHISAEGNHCKFKKTQPGLYELRKI